MTGWYIAVLLIIIVVFVFPSYRAFKREEEEAREALASAMASGKHEPVSIRPYVNPERCMGSGACVRACPEGKILQVIDGQAQIVKGSACVGHGACVRACPVDAIELVFGSERRGIDIPQVTPKFETNVKGLYVAGELGGMGLIANAVEQGEQAVGNACRDLPKTPAGGVDVVVVGAGPAGIAAGLEAQRRGLSVRVLEQGKFGGAIRSYPRQKLVMSRGFKLPGCDRVKSGTISKEDLIGVLGSALRDQGLVVEEQVRVTGVRPTETGFTVATTEGDFEASRIVLAVGRRGTPRRLEVAGEEQAKVAYRLLDPELYQHQHLLVVGGGDSAVEAAITLADQPGNRVTLSYRNDQITRPREANLQALSRALGEGKVHLLLTSDVEEILPDRVRLTQHGEEVVVPNDFVFVFAGGVLPTQFLYAAGITVERHFGKRVEQVDPDV